MVNAFFHAHLSGERSAPDLTGSVGVRETSARIPHQVRGDVSVKRRTRSGLGTSTPPAPRIPVPSPKINNKIKMFAIAYKNFLTIFPDHLAANECCEPRR